MKYLNKGRLLFQQQIKKDNLEIKYNFTKSAEYVK